MKNFRIIPILGLVAAVAFFGFVFFRVRAALNPATNVIVFESSDGEWSDIIFVGKGRNFFTVLWDFEAYKMTHHKPDITLVRVTSRQEGMKDGLEWKVPHASSSGRAKPDIQPHPPLDTDEISRRADLALDYWKAK